MLGDLNKRSIECLIKSGAFDSLNGSRAQKLAVYEEIVDSEMRAGKNNIAGQFSFFGEAETKEDIFPEKVHEYSERELLNMEKEVAGLYLSGHPLDQFRADLQKMNYPTIAEVIEESTENNENYCDGCEISVVGIISNRRDKLTRSNTNMAFIAIEDFTGSMEAIVFPKVLTRLDSILLENAIVMLHGKLDIKEDEGAKLLVDSASPFKGVVESFKLRLSNTQLMKLDGLRNVLSTHTGAYPLEIECSYGNITVNNISVDASEELKQKINKFFGDNVLL